MSTTSPEVIAPRTRTDVREDPGENRPKIRDFVGSLARGLSVLRAFSSERPEMTLTQVAERTNLTRAGARRFLLTLVELGYVQKNMRLFRLTPKVLELGFAYLASTPISRLSQPHLKQITDLTGESCSIAVLDGDEVVFIARTPAKRFLRPGMHVGVRLPVCYTSAGRILVASAGEEAIDDYLARLDLQPRTRRSITSKPALRTELLRVRKQGFAVVDEELEEGLCSISVAVRDPANQVIAAINTATNVAAVPAEKLRSRFLPLLKQAAADIQDTLTS